MKLLPAITDPVTVNFTLDLCLGNSPRLAVTDQIKFAG